MYAVVGCTDCGNVWLLSDPAAAETAQCSRCGTRHQVQRLRHLFESEDRDAARQARAAILAEKHDASDAFADLDSVAEMERQVENAGVSDAEFLAGSGLDPDEVSAAGERQTARRSRSRDELIQEAVEEADDPTEEGIVAYAEERGVPPTATRDLLERLRRRGEVTENGGKYRLL